MGLERDLDPVARLSHWIGHAPDPWQVEAFTTQASEIALRVGRQAGKTSVLAARAVEELHVPDSLTICVAPAERQAKIIAREIGQQLRRTDLVITRSTLTELEMSNGARVVALPSTSDTIRGYPSVSLLIIDECAFLQGENGGEDLISGVLPMLTKDGQVFFSSTPAGRHNYFARLFLDAKPGDNVHRIVVKGTEIPRLKDKVERMRPNVVRHQIPPRDRMRTAFRRHELFRPLNHRTRNKHGGRDMSQDVNYETSLNLVYLPDGRVVNETNQDPAIERVTGHQNYWVAADFGPIQ